MLGEVDHIIILMDNSHQGDSSLVLGRLMVNVASDLGGRHQLLQHPERVSEWLQQQLRQYGPTSGDSVAKYVARGVGAVDGGRFADIVNVLICTTTP